MVTITRSNKKLLNKRKRSIEPKSKPITEYEVLTLQQEIDLLSYYIMRKKLLERQAKLAGMKFIMFYQCHIMSDL